MRGAWPNETFEPSFEIIAPSGWEIKKISALLAQPTRPSRPIETASLQIDDEMGNEMVDNMVDKIVRI